MSWPFVRTKSPPIVPAAEPSTTGWELRSDHTVTQRAAILAEVAFARFANDRLGNIPWAAHHIARVLETYADLDRKAAQQRGEEP